MQITHGVSADAAVEEIQFCLGECGAVARGGDEHVAVSENVIWVCASSAVSIGDGIALEQDAAAGRESGDGFEAEECGCGEEESEWAEEKLAHVRDGIAAVRTSESV